METSRHPGPRHPRRAFRGRTTGRIIARARRPDQICSPAFRGTGRTPGKSRTPARRLAGQSAFHRMGNTCFSNRMKSLGWMWCSQGVSVRT